MTMSLVIVGLLFVSVYLILNKVLGLDPDLSGGIGGLMTIFQPPLHQSLVQGQLRLRRPTIPKGIVPLEGFTLHWYFMLIYAASIVFALNQFSGFMMGFIVGFAGVTGTGVGNALALVTVIVMPVVAYFVGVWIGVRCDKYGVLVLIGSLVLGRILAVSADVFLWPAATAEVTGMLPDSSLLLWGSAWSIWFIPFGLIGLWRGHRVRRERYLRYLISHLPADTRDTLVTMAYEEAQSLSAANDS